MESIWPDRALTVALQGDKPPTTYATLGARCEQAGVDGISVYADLGYQPPAMVLALLASSTTRVQLGAACANPFTRHPLELANDVAMLDALSGGRAWFGIARGAWLDRIGVEAQRPLTAIEESVAVVRALLSGDDRGFEGEVHRLAPGTTLTWPFRRRDVHVVVGTWGPRLAARAARFADELKVGGSANPDLITTVRAWPGVAEMGLAVGAVSVIDDDRAAARRRARTEVAAYLDVVAPLDPTVEVPAGLLVELRDRLTAGDVDGAGALIPDEVLDRFAFAGTPDDVVARAAALVEAGATRIELGTPHGLTAERGIELIGSRVVPAWKELTK